MNLIREKYNDTDKIKEAIAHYTRQIELFPKKVKSYFNRSFFYFLIEEYMKALDDIGKVVSKEPRNIHALCLRGIIYSKIDKHLKALRDFNRTVEIDPTYSPAYICRAFLQMTRDKASRAHKDLNRAVELDPRNSRVYLHRGHIKNLGGDIKSGVEDFQKAVEIAPTLEKKTKKYIQKAYVDAARKSIESQDFAIAVNLLTCYLNEYPEDADTCFNLAEAYMNMEDFENAKKHFERAHHLDPDSQIGVDAAEMLEMIEELSR